MTHHRASTKALKYGEPVFLCFCGMTDFHRFKLGFDRTFWIGEVGDRSQEAAYQTAVRLPVRRGSCQKCRPIRLPSHGLRGVHAKHCAAYSVPGRGGA